MPKTNEKQNIDIAVIKEKVNKIERWIDNADMNHFPTIEKRFDRLDRKLAYWSGGVVVAGALIQVILKKIL